jgi:hypothetical protein
MLTSAIRIRRARSCMVRRLTAPLRNAIVVFASFFLITVG